jgi:LacI family transcriptional regulator
MMDEVAYSFTRMASISADLLGFDLSGRGNFDTIQKLSNCVRGERSFMAKKKSLSVKRERRPRVLLNLHWYSTMLHRGIARFAHEAGWILDGVAIRWGKVPPYWKGDGIVGIYGVDKDFDTFVTEAKLPFVNIGYEPCNLPNVPRVAADHEAIAAMAADHFLQRGFEHFAYYMCTGSMGDRQRMEAFRRALQKAGHSLHCIEHASRSEGDHLMWLGQQIAALPKPLALFAEVDEYAIEAVDACAMAKIRVPEQVAILGVSNDELRSPFSYVPLSSIDDDQERVGYEAAQLLDQLMKRGTVPEQTTFIPPKGVVTRQSSDIMAIQHPHVATALRLIWQRYTDPIDAKRVASTIPLSYVQLHFAFCKHVGRTMAKEIARKRIEHACKLLSDTNIKLSKLAVQSGFSSAERMAKVFHRELHMSPMAWRRQAREHRKRGSNVERN